MGREAVPGARREVARKPICPECGSANVLLDAWASWDAESRWWQVETTFDNGVCEDCSSAERDGQFRHADWVDVELFECELCDRKHTDEFYVLCPVCREDDDETRND